MEWDELGIPEMSLADAWEPIKEEEMIMRRTDIAFEVAILAIGYNFLPAKGPEWLLWFAAIALLIIGTVIVSHSLLRHE